MGQMAGGRPAAGRGTGAGWQAPHAAGTVPCGSWYEDADPGAGQRTGSQSVLPGERCAGMRSPGVVVTSQQLRAAAAGSPAPDPVGWGVRARGKHPTRRKGAPRTDPCGQP